MIWRYDQAEELRAYMNIYDKVPYVVTGGHMDPLHIGHLNLIWSAANFGKVIVAINNDESTIKKKGYRLVPIEHRLAVTESLLYVAHVIENEDDDMCELLKILRPQFYCKGGDVNEKTLLQSEKDICKGVGCEIKYGVGGFDKRGSSSTFFQDAMDQYFLRKLEP